MRLEQAAVLHTGLKIRTKYQFDWEGPILRDLDRSSAAL